MLQALPKQKYRGASIIGHVRLNCHAATLCDKIFDVHELAVEEVVGAGITITGMSCGRAQSNTLLQCDRVVKFAVDQDGVGGHGGIGHLPAAVPTSTRRSAGGPAPPGAAAAGPGRRCRRKSRTAPPAGRDTRSHVVQHEGHVVGLAVAASCTPSDSPTPRKLKRAVA
jgi:hypothetical protein